MKGIKECTKWMLDNPMKVLKQVHTEQSTLWNQLRYNDTYGCIEVAWYGDETDWRLSEEPFKALNQGTWEEVKEQVDFLTALEDVKNRIGAKYRGVGIAYQDEILQNDDGLVLIYDKTRSRYVEPFEHKWIKED